MGFLKGVGRCFLSRDAHLAPGKCATKGRTLALFFDGDVLCYSAQLSLFAAPSDDVILTAESWQIVPQASCLRWAGRPVRTVLAAFESDTQ